MYAVVEIGGMQWKVSEAETICVPKMKAEPGKTVDLGRILLLVDKDKVNIGNPVLSGTKVKATVVSHGKAEKIKVFKKKRRKNYKVLKGHRQEYTELRIDRISIEKKKAATVPKEKTEAKKTEASVKAEVKSPASSDKKKPQVKKAVVSDKAPKKKTAATDKKEAKEKEKSSQKDKEG